MHGYLKMRKCELHVCWEKRRFLAMNRFIDCNKESLSLDDFKLNIDTH